MTHTLILLVLLFFQNPQQPHRPTEPTDPMPPPNMDYFIGAWSLNGMSRNLRWVRQESSRAGDLQKQAKGSTYESLIEGDGPAGPFKGRALTEYNEKDRIVTRTESALFGLSIKKTGPIGGDLGGYYTIFWETEPIKKTAKPSTFAIVRRRDACAPARMAMRSA
ncbi:MAG: hypothetical protein IPJ07_09055 [Acidobacteria bacterium]|nr:hypothetical protein [Acidobacteriota bacterium]